MRGRPGLCRLMPGCAACSPARSAVLPRGLGLSVGGEGLGPDHTEVGWAGGGGVCGERAGFCLSALRLCTLWLWFCALEAP